MVDSNVDASIQLPSRLRGQRVTNYPDQTIVWLSGEQDASTASELSRTLFVEAEALATASPGSRLLVDVTEVTFLDAAIIGALLNVNAHWKLQVRGSPRCVQRLFTICEIGALFA